MRAELLPLGIEHELREHVEADPLGEARFGRRQRRRIAGGERRRPFVEGA